MILSREEAKKKKNERELIQYVKNTIFILNSVAVMSSEHCL